MASIEEDSLVVFYHLSASEIWLDINADLELATV